VALPTIINPKKLGTDSFIFMAEIINWLHLTDLHFGLDDQGWLWPKIKREFFRDVAQLAGDIGGWDIVFFTGDLTQCGSEAEFNRLSQELEELWGVLSKSGSTPQLCLVPGNHDLMRPASDSAIGRTITQLWWNNPDLRRKFWADPHCEYRTAVEGFFANYSTWSTRLPVPAIPTKPGVLPGDFSATFEKGARKLGIVGLNSTFLQIGDGEFKGKLELHISQLNKVCDGDATRWLENRDANVFLTHQPPSWLAPEALDHFRQEIYPPGRFLSQLCGHQHEPEAFEISEAGAAPRRLRQGASLFGLENWKGVTPQKRIHGYAAGQFIFEQSGSFEKLWPRIALTSLHGGLNIAPDHRYQLEHDCIVTPFDINEKESISETVPPTISSEADSAGSQKVTTPKDIDLHLLEAPPDEQSARKHLASCPRLPSAAGPQHRQIRLEEQSQFELELRKSRCTWLAADWGIGKDDFLVSAIERFRKADLLPEVFHLKCDDAANIDAFETLFPQQCGMPLQQFCGFLGAIKEAFLVFDGIHPALCSGEQLVRLKRIVSAILDYCPDLRLVLSSRLLPENGIFPSLELRPLDVPDVRTYLMHHPDATPALREADVVEKLHEQSDGLPMHLDKMLKALKVSSLASVLEADMEGASTIENLPESTPKALIHAVSILAKSQDRSSKRSFRLLKVLTVLSYGETLDALRHYLPAEPFFYENALQLHEFALLDVVPLQQTLPKIGFANAEDQNVPKLLKVPRQVRDYVHTLISDEERREIVAAGVERFFGRGWREGKVKIRNLPAEYREYLSSGAGNEFAIIHHLIAQGRQASDQSTVQKAAILGVLYSRHLKKDERYRDLAIVAGALTQTVDRDEHPDEWCDLASFYGEGLRMTDKNVEALTYLRAALELGESHFTDEQKASIWLNIALAEKSLNHKDEAVEAAEKIKQYSKPESGNYLYALSIIAEQTLKVSEKTKQLSEIEKHARQRGYDILANTISLMLATECEKPKDRIQHLDKVLASGNRGYNHYRAIISKALVVQNLKKPAELKPQEIGSLTAAYSYLHAQRFSGLFDRCHEALWRVYEADGNPTRLLRLFRHSSFVWRIRGDEAKEKENLDRLRKRDIKPTDTSNQKTFVIEIGYYMKRLKIVIIDVITPKPSTSS
jgi:tetratricopeptide (TPR) repeat protein